MKNIIPTQNEGKQLDCFETVEYDNAAIASEVFAVAKARLLAINQWYEVAKIPAAVFKLVDNQNHLLDRSARVHDHIRIDIPGPGLQSTHGYDWVEVVDLIEKEEPDYRFVVITMRPCADPTSDNPDTAHFFKNLATSTLLIEQKANNILYQYAGRNETINLDNESQMDNIRNFLVGLGAKLGASYPQWKALVKGLSETTLS